MSDTVTPIRKDVQTGNVTKQQMLDYIAETFDGTQQEPVAIVFAFVDARGGGTSRYFVASPHDKVSSLYVARGTQMLLYDGFEHQRELNEGQ